MNCVFAIDSIVLIEQCCSRQSDKIDAFIPESSFSYDLGMGMRVDLLRENSCSAFGKMVAFDEHCLNIDLVWHILILDCPGHCGHETLPLGQSSSNL